jgi:hypothetical protein
MVHLSNTFPTTPFNKGARPPLPKGKKDKRQPPTPDKGDAYINGPLDTRKDTFNHFKNLKNLAQHDLLSRESNSTTVANYRKINSTIEKSHK